MSKTEILEELPRLTPEDRYEIRVKLAELDGDRWLDDDDPLTDEQKALLDAPRGFHQSRRRRRCLRPSGFVVNEAHGLARPSRSYSPVSIMSRAVKYAYDGDEIICHLIDDAVRKSIFKRRGKNLFGERQRRQSGRARNAGPGGAAQRKPPAFLFRSRDRVAAPN